MIRGGLPYTCNINQFGFRANHRTTDSIFILRSLISKYLKKNKGKMYACFVDLRKAFDYGIMGLYIS